MAIIAGATYVNGLAINSDGAVYVRGLASASLVPVAATASGAMPRGGLKVDPNGQLYVRYV